MISFILLLLFHILLLYNNNVNGQAITEPFTPPPVPTNFQGDNSPPPQNESWLKQNNRFVFVIILGLLAVLLILWYIFKSIKGMRKRLKRENEAQMAIMEQATAYHNNSNNNNNTIIPPPPSHPLSSPSSSSSPPASPTSPTTTANTTNIINNYHNDNHDQKDQITYPEKVKHVLS